MVSRVPVLAWLDVGNTQGRPREVPMCASLHYGAGTRRQKSLASRFARHCRGVQERSSKVWHWLRS